MSATVNRASKTHQLDPAIHHVGPGATRARENLRADCVLVGVGVGAGVGASGGRALVRGGQATTLIRRVGLLLGVHERVGPLLVERDRVPGGGEWDRAVG